jgi:hypothetical protein
MHHTQILYDAISGTLVVIDFERAEFRGRQLLCSLSTNEWPRSKVEHMVILTNTCDVKPDTKTRSRRLRSRVDEDSTADDELDKRGGSRRT